MKEPAGRWAVTAERQWLRWWQVALLGEAKLQHCLQEVHHMQEMQMLAGRALSDPRPTFPIGSSYNVVNYYTPSSPLFRPNTSSRPGARRASWAAGASRHRWSTASSPDAEGGDSRVPPLHEVHARRPMRARVTTLISGITVTVIVNRTGSVAKTETESVCS